MTFWWEVNKFTAGMQKWCFFIKRCINLRSGIIRCTPLVVVQSVWFVYVWFSIATGSVTTKKSCVPSAEIERSYSLNFVFISPGNSSGFCNVKPISWLLYKSKLLFIGILKYKICPSMEMLTRLAELSFSCLINFMGSWKRPCLISDLNTSPVLFWKIGFVRQQLYIHFSYFQLAEGRVKV